MIDLIVLNGASSAGKTSLARALQASLEEPWILLEEDAFVQRTLAPRFEAQSLDDPILAKTLRGYHSSLTAFVSVGWRVIADLGLYTDEIKRSLIEETSHIRTLIVGVYCDPDELDRREERRGDRPLGLGRTQSGFIHHDLRYHLEVDTTDGDLERCAREIAVQFSPLPSGGEGAGGEGF